MTNLGPIGVIGGTGAHGYGLALRWAQAGETVIVGSRDGARATQTAEKLKGKLGSATNISGETNAAVCAACKLVVLTVPYEGHAELLKELKSAIRPGSIVVDTTVPLIAASDGRGRTRAFLPKSVAEQAAEILGPEVSVVAAFENVGSKMLTTDGPVDCDVIVCGDDPVAVKTARQLAARIPGIRGLDGGPLANACALEHITSLLIHFSVRNKAHCGIRITGLPASAGVVE
ncbi:MAG TPA: NADPH-dependent F420 reductase [Terriglobales bacterium]